MLRLRVPEPPGERNGRVTRPGGAYRSQPRSVSVQWAPQEAGGCYARRRGNPLMVLQTLVVSVVAGAALLILLLIVAGILGAVVLVVLFAATMLSAATFLAVVLYAVLGGFDQRARSSPIAPGGLRTAPQPTVLRLPGSPVADRSPSPAERAPRWRAIRSLRAPR